MHLRNCFALALLLVAASCPLESRLLQPVERADGQSIDTSRLYVATIDSCQHLDQTVAPTTAPPPPTTKNTVYAPNGFDIAIVSLFVNGSKCYLHATAWNDANGNGVIDSGDALGSLPAAVLVEDGGLNWCGDDPTDGELLVLPIVP
jgi:hypothetical protein